MAARPHRGGQEGDRSTAELARPLVEAPERAAHRLRREVGPVGLVFASLGSIIGAGWLFGALYASSLAGPAAIVSWVLGGGAMMLLALAHAELGGAYPVAGGNARFPHYAFGSLIGFTGGWVAFLGAATVGPIMVQAPLLYASNYVSSLTTVSGGRPVLTAQGYVVAAALLLLFCTINVMGVRWLSEANTIAVCWKIFVPALTVVALLLASAHGENFGAGGGFMPSGWKGVFLAVSSGGVVFACLGFEQAVQLGGESRNPGRNIPLAIIGAMSGAIGLYVALQVAFVAALDPSAIAHGWSTISFSGKGQLFGPFAGLATALGLGWLAVLLYTDAIVSPAGTGLLYTGASARLSFALARDGCIPSAFAG
jgi:amino acid transporter